jgi:hypothetical protein
MIRTIREVDFNSVERSDLDAIRRFRQNGAGSAKSQIGIHGEARRSRFTDCLNRINQSQFTNTFSL